MSARNEQSAKLLADKAQEFAWQRTNRPNLVEVVVRMAAISASLTTVELCQPGEPGPLL